MTDVLISTSVPNRDVLITANVPTSNVSIQTSVPTVNVGVPVGIQGPVGETGATGATGNTGATGADGEDAFVYIAYASDASGTDFTNTFDANLDFIAILSTDTEIVTPQASDFTGLWKNYKGATGDTGATGSTGPAGADGATWTSGATDPDDGDGANGDFYLQTGTGATGVLGDVWLKAGGSWSINTNIRGPAGSGDVSGPGSSTTGNLASFGDTSGALLADSGVAAANVLVDADIGTNVQAHGDVLDDLNTLGAATADGEFVVATGAGVFAYESGATARTSLGLGTGDSPTFTGITADGGRILADGDTHGNNGIGVVTVSLGELEVRGNGTGAAAMTFHRPGAHAAYFGLDTDNQLKLGGWSLGTTAKIVAFVSEADQTITGGARVTSLSDGTKSSGTYTPDPGDRPMIHITNGGAFTLAPGANGGAYILDITNNASAGAITTSGWTKVAGDAFTTTNTEAFRCHCSIGNAGSLLVVQALQ